MTGESRGKLFRTQLVKTAARLRRARTRPSRACRCSPSTAASRRTAIWWSRATAAPPDWGTGPNGKGKLYKISYTDREHPQPVLVYPAGPREVRVEFDRPVDPQLAPRRAGTDEAHRGEVRPGRRPLHDALAAATRWCRAQRLTPRFDVPVHSAQLTPDRRTLILATDPLPAAVHYALTLPGMGRPTKPREGRAAAARGD